LEAEWGAVEDHEQGATLEAGEAVLVAGRDVDGVSLAIRDDLSRRQYVRLAPQACCR
jgi:hypothetical protein